MIYLPEEILETIKGGVFDLYLRKSSKDSEDKQMRSIPGQLKDIQDQILNRYNIQVGKVFKESQTAYKTGRPHFQELLERSQQGLTTGHIMWHPNRGARNHKDGGEYLE